MRAASGHIRKALRSAWWCLRQITGDAAYETYLHSAASPRDFGCGNSDGAPILSREEFYLDALRRKYSGVSRCC